MGEQTMQANALITKGDRPKDQIKMLCTMLCKLKINNFMMIILFYCQKQQNPGCLFFFFKFKFNKNHDQCEN